MKKVLPLVVAASMLLSTATSFAATNSDTTAKFLEKKFNVADSTKEFRTIKTQVDQLGYKHVKVEQVVNGIPVYGNEYFVHYDANGNVYASKGQYDVKAKDTKVAATLTAKEAVNAAKAAVNFVEVKPTQQLMADKFDANLYLYEVNGQYVPTYVVKANWLHDNTFGNYVVFVNAANGEVINQYNNTKDTAATGTGTGILNDTKTINLDLVSGTYYLRDVARAAQTETLDAKNGTSSLYYMTDTDTTWNSTVQKAGVDAHYYIGKTYDYYKNVLGRSGMNDRNIDHTAIVHYSVNYVNAFWNGTYLVFGDGDGSTSLCLAGGLDIVAHEYSHGVTDYVSDLVYQNESGALNESFSDIMAVAVEKYVQPTKWDWLMGEDVWKDGVALRDLSDPTRFGDPDHYNNRYIGTADNGGVHWNSGIPNHAAYMMGSNAAIGVDGMAKIWMRANDVYLSRNATFSEARQDTIQAAADLGYSTSVVAAAWDHVGVY